jgi:hypothetical protein
MSKHDGRAPTESTMNKTSYQDSRVVKAEILKFTPVDFQLAFNEVAISRVILIRDIVGVVRSVMGGEVPLWILNKFVSLGRQMANYKTITWPQFRFVNIC